MTQARLIGENEASIPGNGRLDQSFPKRSTLNRSQALKIASILPVITATMAHLPWQPALTLLSALTHSEWVVLSV